MKILVPVKRVVDYNVKVRVRPDGTGVEDGVLPGLGVGVGVVPVPGFGVGVGTAVAPGVGVGAAGAGR